MKSAIITFFDSYPPKTGSGIVCSDFFSSWPVKKKKCGVKSYLFFEFQKEN